MSNIQAGVAGSTTSGGAIIVSQSGNTTIGSGSKAVATAGTRVQLSSVSVPIVKVTIQAKVGNTGSIYVGDSTVATSNGIALTPLNSVVITVNNLNLIWLDSDVNGEGVTFLYENA